MFFYKYGDKITRIITDKKLPFWVQVAVQYTVDQGEKNNRGGIWL